jgi:hypothetical protein
MPWTVIEGNPSDIDDNISSFESGVSSVDDFDITATGPNRVVAVLKYTA